MLDVFSDYTLRTVALGAGAIGVVSGWLGVYAVLRRQSLLGDVVSHAALPGIVIAFVLTGSKAPLVLILGAALAGFASTLCVLAVTRTTRVKVDSALALVLSVFFGVGLMLLTWVQSRPDARQAGLDRYLFGQAAALVERDVMTIAVLGAVAITVSLVLWKELKVLCFDRDFGATLGLRMTALEVVLTALLVVAVVIGLQAVGVVLMTAMVIAPAAAARQWTDRLGLMVVLAAAFGALGGVSGALVSASAERVPAGPMIVLCLTAIVVASLLGSPRRGLVARRVLDRRRARALRLGATLGGLDVLAREHPAGHGHSAAVIALVSGPRTDESLAELERRGWARRVGADEWALTESGREQAERHDA